MSGTKVNWSIWQLPVGPEVAEEKQRVFRAPREETMKQYDRLRQENGNFGLCVTDENGDPVFACS